MARDPLIADTNRMLIDHHQRLAVVEVETRESRNDVAELRQDVSSISQHLHAQDVAMHDGIARIATSIADLAADVKPLISSAAIRQQQGNVLLVYAFSAVLSLAGGLFGGWVSNLAHLSAVAQTVVLAASAAACFIAARLVLARSHHQ